MSEQLATTCDVLVIGSGAGGLAAAVTAKKHGLDVLVIEKDPWLGGTTALSGGWLWVPCNPLAQRAGVADSPDQARLYLRHELGDRYDEARIDAFLEAGPGMVDFFERETAVRFFLGADYPDYHPDAPGALPGGRAVCAEPFTISARRGVVCAAGGFPHDVARRKKLFPQPTVSGEYYSLASSGNSGDGLRMAERAGAAIEASCVNPAAWMPVSRVRRPDGGLAVYPHTFDRGKPGIIAVTAGGKRFVNEGNSYHDVGEAMLRVQLAGADGSAFLICDHPAIRRYGLGMAKPFPVPLAPHLRSGYLKRGRTMEELAAQAGIDPQGLCDTIRRFNAAAREGRDPEFGRGTNVYNRYQGDPAGIPTPCLAPIATPPFYAVRIFAGDLGTFAGLRTDGKARVLARDGAPIPGLYAAGTDMASIFGGCYPGPGINLGPAMTFGYIAARHLAAGAG